MEREEIDSKTKLNCINSERNRKAVVGEGGGGRANLQKMCVQCEEGKELKETNRLIMFHRFLICLLRHFRHVPWENTGISTHH